MDPLLPFAHELLIDLICHVCDPIMRGFCEECAGGHGLHVDSCGYDLLTGVCTYQRKNCCAWRTHSGILYLDDPAHVNYSGGNLQFVDGSHHGARPWEIVSRRVRVPMGCGKLFMFESGPSTLHGVQPVRGSGLRHAMAFWFTDPDTVADSELVRKHGAEASARAEMCLVDPPASLPDASGRRAQGECLCLDESGNVGSC